MEVAESSSIQMHPDSKGSQHMIKGADGMIPMTSPSDMATKDKSSGDTYQDSPYVRYREGQGIGENYENENMQENNSNIRVPDQLDEFKGHIEMLSPVKDIYCHNEQYISGAQQEDQDDEEMEEHENVVQ